MLGEREKDTAFFFYNLAMGSVCRLLACTLRSGAPHSAVFEPSTPVSQTKTRYPSHESQFPDDPRCSSPGLRPRLLSIAGLSGNCFVVLGVPFAMFCLRRDDTRGVFSSPQRKLASYASSQSVIRRG